MSAESNPAERYPRRVTNPKTSSLSDVSDRDRDEGWMERALALARTAARKSEVPIAAVIVSGGRILAKSHNLTRTRRDPTAHAEIVVLQRAARRAANERLTDATLYVTLEPCAMCAGAIIQARIPRVVYAAPDPKAGACGSVLSILPHPKLNHRPNVRAGVRSDEAAALLRSFFRQRRRGISVPVL